MAHESLVHMWDAETVENEHISVDGDVACDGIDEYIDVSLQLATSKEGIRITQMVQFTFIELMGKVNGCLKPWTELLVKRAHEKVT